MSFIARQLQEKCQEQNCPPLDCLFRSNKGVWYCRPRDPVENSSQIHLSLEFYNYDPTPLRWNEIFCDQRHFISEPFFVNTGVKQECVIVPNSSRFSWQQCLNLHLKSWTQVLRCIFIWLSQTWKLTRTWHVPEFLDHHLNLLVCNAESYVKDTHHFFRCWLVFGISQIVLTCVLRMW